MNKLLKNGRLCLPLHSPRIVNVIFSMTNWKWTRQTGTDCVQWLSDRWVVLLYLQQYPLLAVAFWGLFTLPHQLKLSGSQDHVLLLNIVFPPHLCENSLIGWIELWGQLSVFIWLWTQWALKLRELPERLRREAQGLLFYRGVRRTLFAKNIHVRRCDGMFLWS